MKPAQLAAFSKLIADRMKQLGDEDATGHQGQNSVVLDQQNFGRLSRVDVLQQQAMANGAHQRRVHKRGALKAAVARIADGTCDDDIAIERLRLEPAIALCPSYIKG